MHVTPAEHRSADRGDRDMDRAAATRLPLALLRSQARIFFQPSWLTGLLLLAAFAVASPLLAGFALLGAAVQSATAWFIPALDRADVVEGKHGFCGALSAVAAGTALGPTPAALVWAVAGSVACAGVVLLMDRGRTAELGLPAMTAPFCAVSSAALLATASMQSPPPAFAYHPTGTLLDPVTAVLLSVAQVVLLDNVWSGALILAGLFAARWAVGLWALVGAAVASAVAWAVGADADGLLNGLDGYSGVLVALSLGLVFVRSRYRVPITLAGVALTVPVRLLLAGAGVPVYTWPFVLVTWAALVLIRLARSRTKGGSGAPPRRA